jgi:hypothetical protein
MLHYSAHDVLGRAAYMKRSCEILLGQLQVVDRMFSGTEELMPMQEAAISRAAVSAGERASEHLELASRFIENWKLQLRDALDQVGDVSPFS